MFIYIVYILLTPIVWFILLLSSFFNSKIGEHWNDLWISINSAAEKVKKNNLNKKTVLFHAASAGEFEQLIPILSLIDKNKFYIVQSFFSPTIFKKQPVQNLYDCFCYHPFDFVLSSYIFFKKIKPDYYIINRHDIWPSHIFMAKFLKIKIFFINANLYKQSNRLKFPFKNFNKLLFKQFDKILSPSKRISKNIKELVSSNIVKTTGDSRFDQINQRMKKNKIIFFKNTTNRSKKIIMGSILKSDYEIIFNFLKTYFPNGDKSLIDKKIKLIIVPHEVDRQSVSELQKKLKKISIISKLYSSEDNNNIPNSLIVDKIGILADIYKYADFVYIGGGFEAGVHSVIEPSVYGSIITYGPNINILNEAVEMTKKKIGFIVKNHLELINYFNFVNDEEKILNIKKLTKNYVAKNTGASRKIITELFN